MHMAFQHVHLRTTYDLTIPMDMYGCSFPGCMYPSGSIYYPVLTVRKPLINAASKHREVSIAKTHPAREWSVPCIDPYQLRGMYGSHRGMLARVTSNLSSQGNTKRTQSETCRYDLKKQTGERIMLCLRPILVKY
jgi:hypothetical protein